MVWTTKFNDLALRQFNRLDRQAQQRIRNDLEEHIDGSEDPRQFGAGLTGDQAGRWRYRIGDYRVICTFDEEELTVMVAAVAHRRQVYRRR